MCYHLLSLSLKRKFLIIMLVFIGEAMVIFSLSYQDLQKVQSKFQIAELTYKLNSIILDSRRHEKNFLLYGTPDSLQQAQITIHTAQQTIKKFPPIYQQLSLSPLLQTLELLIDDYAEKNRALAAILQQNTLPFSQFVAKEKLLISAIRDTGHEMTKQSEFIISFEHRKIRTILSELLRQLFLWTAIALAVGILFPSLFFINAMRSLKAVKKVTEDIGNGNFSKISIRNKKDEILQILSAFNTMSEAIELRQKQLVQSQKLSSIGTLTAGVAHQLNNPLNNIATSSQIASLESPDGDRLIVEEMVKNIQKESERARDIVQGLLEFSRTTNFNIQATDLEKICQRVIQLVQSQIPPEQQLHCNVPSQLIVPMDAPRIQEVLLNMIINASQAIDGCGTICLTAKINPYKTEVIIEIADSGCGISPQQEERIFDPFYTTKKEGQGTGLGLAIAYGIIQKHHGKILLSSSKGKGSSFYIHLPLPT